MVLLLDKFVPSLSVRLNGGFLSPVYPESAATVPTSVGTAMMVEDTTTEKASPQFWDIKWNF